MALASAGLNGAHRRHYQISDPNTDPPTTTEYFDTPTAVTTVLAELPTSFVSLITAKIIKTTDALGSATYTLYDKFDRQIATYDATKHQTSASLYDAIDRIIKSTDTYGQTTQYTYQDTAKQKLTLDSFGNTSIEIFDITGNLTDSIDTLNRRTHYDYDNRNRQTLITNAAGGTTKYTYYNDGQTKSITDAAQNTTAYLYDIAGRLSQEDTIFGSRTYRYDLVNNRTQTTDRNGRTIKYAYDNLNRLKSETWVNGSQTFTYTYDKNGNILTANDGSIKYDYSYDKTDLLTRVDRIQTNQPTVSFKYEYDNIGNLTQTDEIIANQLTATTIYKYNDLRHLNTEIIQTGIGLTSKDVKFTYNPAGANTKIQRYVNGVLKLTTTNTFDTHGRLKQIEQRNSSNETIANVSYELDDLSRVKTETKDGVSRSISYDNTDQVQTVTGINSEGYTYDKNGNRTNAGYVTGAGNQLKSDGTYTYDYDAEGNRTKRTKIADRSVDIYTWDYRNRLESITSKDAAGIVTQVVGYEYDVDDQRVKKTVDGVVENYYLDGEQIAFVTDGGGDRAFHYLYGTNIDQVLAQDSSTGMVWALADRLGSIDTLTDADGVVVESRTYDSFGNLLSATPNSQLPTPNFRYGYTGRELDLESGLDYYRARYYDPAVGRFISVDPMGFGAGDTNLYRYVGNNSTNATDPTGEAAQIFGGLVIGGVVGGIFALGRQFAKMTDGGSFDGSEVLAGVAGGAVGGAALAANPALALPLAGFGFGSGMFSAYNEYRQRHYSTAAYDAITSVLGLGIAKWGGGSGAATQLAGGFSKGAALIADNSISIAGGLVGGLFNVGAYNAAQHVFAMINGDGSGGNNDSQDSVGSSGDDTITKPSNEIGVVKTAREQLQVRVNRDGIPEKTPGTKNVLYGDTLPDRLLSYDDKGKPTKLIPLGFSSSSSFKNFSSTLISGLKDAGYKAQAFFQGSSVTGFKQFTKPDKAAGTIFDTGKRSDFDIAIANKELFDLAVKQGARVKRDSNAIGPLTGTQIKALGLKEVHTDLEKNVDGREVNFMLFQNAGQARGKKDSYSIEAKGK